MFIVKISSREIAMLADKSLETNHSPIKNNLYFV